MQLNHTLTGQTCRVNIDTNLDIRTVSWMRNRLFQLLDTTIFRTLELEFQGINQIDEAGIGLLIDLSGRMKTRQGTLLLKNVSRRFVLNILISRLSHFHIDHESPHIPASNVLISLQKLKKHTNGHAKHPSAFGRAVINDFLRDRLSN